MTEQDIDINAICKTITFKKDMTKGDVFLVTRDLQEDAYSQGIEIKNITELYFALIKKIEKEKND